MNIQELKKKSSEQLIDEAEKLGIENASTLKRQEIYFAILKKLAEKGEEITGGGVLQLLQDGFGFLRAMESNYLPGADDIYISPNQIRKFGLRTGDTVEGPIRAPKDGERYFALLQVNKINFEQPEKSKHKIAFDNLTPLYPNKQITLEVESNKVEKKPDLTARLIDLVSPIGKGQRSLIISPPKAGKTMILQSIANSITANHPECYLMVLLIDERPEEVTDMQRTVNGEVISSTFDEPSKRHAQVSDLVLERARRLVELGEDVVILLDSLTRLARGYNNSQRGGGPVGTGGLSPQALQKRRNVQNMLDDLHAGDKVVTPILAFQDVGRRETIVDLQTLVRCMRPCNVDRIGRGIDRRHLAAQPGETFGKNAAAASDIQDSEPLQGMQVAGVTAKPCAQAVADISQANRVKTVQRAELAVKIPPFFCHRLKFIYFSQKYSIKLKTFRIVVLNDIYTILIKINFQSFDMINSIIYYIYMV